MDPRVSEAAPDVSSARTATPKPRGNGARRGRVRGGLRFVRRNPLLSFGIMVVAGSIFLALFGPMLAPYDPESPTGTVSAPPPNPLRVPGLVVATIKGDLEKPVHWFGTDSAGLDVFSRVIAAPRIDVLVAISAAALSLVIGTLLGLVAGYSRGRWAEFMTRVSDVIQAFPVFILAMILVVLSGRNLLNIVIAIAFLSVPIFLRLTRSHVLTQRNRTYVEAARVLGNRESVIALKHVLPNSLAPSLIQSSVMVGWGILLVAGLSFIGAGVRPPTPEWGGMIATGSNLIILGEWWPSIFPGIAISITVFGYAIVGNVLERRYGGSA